MDPRESHGETRQQLSSQTCITPSQSSTPKSFQQTWITFHSIQRIMVPVPCCLHVFEDIEAVIKMIIEGRSATLKHVSRTHRVALDWLFDKIYLDPKIQIRHIDTKHQLADIEWKKFHTWWVKQSSSFVQYQPFQPHLLHQEFQLGKLVHNGEEDTWAKRKKGCVQVATCSDESIFFHSNKFLHRIKSDCI